MAIKVYFSDQVGAPIVNGMVGSLIALLDACLVNGYNQTNIATITRNGSVVTVETTTAHGFTSPRDNYWSADGVGNIATIAGADQAAYNGEWPVTVLNATTFTFNLGLATPDSPATGTLLSCKRAPAGFSKAFQDTNRGVYRSNDITSRRFFLQVDDTANVTNGQGARFAWWRGYEKMRGMDDGDKPFPAFTQSGMQGQFIRKSSALNTSSQRWTLISDGKAFFLQIHIDVGGVATGVSIYSGGCFFGDFMPMAPDGYAVYIDADNNASIAYFTTTNAGVFQVSSGSNPGNGTGWSCIARRYNGQGNPVWAAGKIGHGLYNNAYCLGLYGGVAYPDPFSNRLYASQVKLFEGGIARGLLPFYETPSGVVHSDREIVTNIAGREGRVMMYLRGGCFNSGYIGGLYFDLTGEDTGKWS